MLDFGFVELLMIIAVAVFVIGPQDIPKVMMALGRVMRRISYIRYAFTHQFEDFMRQNDLEDIRRQVNFEEKDFDEAAADEEMLPEPDSDSEPEQQPERKKEAVND